MDFALTPEQEFFRKTIRDIVQKMVVPRAAEIDEKDEFPWDLWREFSKLGFLGLRYPPDVGGIGADQITCVIFYEEITKGSVGFAQSVIMNMLMGTHFVYKFGNDKIKERCLLPAIRGEKIATICFTEEQSGSDLSSIKTTAIRDGDYWILNGRKQWITNGPICDFATVLATTDPKKGLKGLNFFLVERGMPGFYPGQIIKKIGCRGTVTGELILDNCKVPAENLLGDEVDKGLEYLMEILSEIRIMTGAMAIGIAEAAFAEGLEYARKRIAFGHPIGHYQLIRSKFANMATELEAARLLVWKAAWMLDKGLPCTKEAAMAKMFATETCLKIVDEVTRIYGANGMAEEYAPQRHFRDARFLLYGGGTHEVLSDFLGKLILGKL